MPPSQSPAACGSPGVGRVLSRRARLGAATALVDDAVRELGTGADPWLPKHPTQGSNLFEDATTLPGAIDRALRERLRSGVERWGADPAQLRQAGAATDNLGLPWARSRLTAMFGVESPCCPPGGGPTMAAPRLLCSCSTAPARVRGHAVGAGGDVERGGSMDFSERLDALQQHVAATRAAVQGEPPRVRWRLVG